MVVRVAAGLVGHIDLERAVGLEADFDRRIVVGIRLISEMPFGF
jgi:hypothetical protein